MLNKIRIINQAALQNSNDNREPVIFTLLGLPREPDGAVTLMHKSVLGNLNSDMGVIAGVTMLFIEGNGMINPAEVTLLNCRIVFHNAEGILIGDIIEAKDIYNILLEGCKNLGLPAPPPMITPNVESQIIPMPFNPNSKSLKS